MKESLEKIVLPQDGERDMERAQKVSELRENSQQEEGVALAEPKDQDIEEQQKTRERTDQTEKEVRDFSKTFSPEERKEIVDEVKEKRRRYFEKQKSTGEKISVLHLNIEARKESIKFLSEEIENLESELGANEQSLVTRFLNKFGISKRLSQLRAELGAKQEITSEFEEELFENQELIRNLEKQRHDRSDLEEAKQAVVMFYTEQAREFKEQMDIRDISRQTKRTGEFFVHAIHPDFIPSSNSLLNVDTDWQTKLDIFLAFQPTVSASSIGKGNTPNNMWARMGLIVNNGTIEIASSQDAATKAISLKKRGNKLNRISDNDIDEAVKGKGNHYNEFAVALPRVAGFFICRDKDERDIPSNLVPTNEIVQKCRELAMPVFEIKNGVLYETAWNDERGELTATQPLSPDEINEHRYDVGEEARHKSIDRFLDKSPFKVVPKDVELIEHSTCGRDIYLVLNKGCTVNANGKEYKFKRAGTLDEYHDIKEGTSVNLVSEFPSVHGRTLYFTKDGKLYRQWIDTAKESFYKGTARVKHIISTEVYDPQNEAFRDQEERLQRGLFELAGGRMDKVGQPIVDSDSYLAGMQNKIKRILEEGKIEVIKYEAELIKAKTAHDKEYVRVNLLEWSKRRNRDEVRQLASHVHGFAEQATEMGDLETARKAREIVAAILPESEYQEIIKRVDSDGHIKLRKEDIGFD